MKDASLQLMVYGKDIKNADVTVNYPGVKVDTLPPAGIRAEHSGGGLK